jgi:hypothetical protein
MKKRILLAMLLFASVGSVSAQSQCFGPNIAVNGDFQTYTGTVSGTNTWINNSLDNWSVSHGTPSPNGNLSMWMWSYSGAGEGIYMGHNFVAGETYRLTYELWQSADANPNSTFLVDLTNGLIPNSSTTLPTPTQQFAVTNQGWTNPGSTVTITEVFTVPTGQSFSQLWFRPFLSGQPTPNQATARIDNVVIEELIECPCDVNAAFEFQGNCVMEFIDASSGGTDPANQIMGYSWNFDDGQTSTDQSPTHNFTSPGTYNVCLTIWAGSGIDCCSDTYCQSVVVTDSCAPCDYIALNASAAVTCDLGGACTFTASGVSNDFPNATGYFWSFGDGNYGSGEEAMHIYATSGTYVACLTVYYQDPVTGDCCSHEVCIDVQAL